MLADENHDQLAYNQPTIPRPHANAFAVIAFQIYTAKNL
jgi:hypothetical protein